MSLITLTNKTGGQLVCSLKSGNTLRLNNKQSTTVKDTEVTQHLETLVSKGLVISRVVKEKEITPTPKKSKEKTVKED